MISEDITISFGLEKCAKITMKREKLVAGTDLVLSNGEAIKEVNAGVGYKYPKII
jgi:hypothetical protein